MLYFSDLMYKKSPHIVGSFYIFLVIAAAEKEDRNKDYPQATVIVIKKTLDTHSEIHLTHQFQYIL